MLTFPVCHFSGSGSASSINWASLPALSVAENAANGASVGTASATGGVGALSYSIVAGNSAGVFAINSSSGAITIASNTNLNYEATASYSLTLRATDSSTPTAQTADATQVVNVTNVTELPVNTAIPAITGTAQVGQTLSASTGSWTSAAGSLSYAYQWKRGGTAISGATASSYAPVVADIGSALTVTVTATNSDGSANATSNATSAVTPLPISWPSLSALSIAENAVNGASVGTATATGGTSPLSYSIVAGNSAGVFAINSSTGAITIASNTNLNYEVTTSYSLTLRATDSTTPTAQTADATQVVNVTNVTELPVNTAIPTISGTAQTGQTLTASTGSWTSAAGSLSYAYQWKRGGTSISGATASSYTLVSADIGSTITVTVTATNADGSANATSNATAEVTAGSGGSLPTASLDFDGSTDYLTLTNTNWGTFNRQKGAVAMSFKTPSTGTATQVLFWKGSCIAVRLLARKMNLRITSGTHYQLTTPDPTVDQDNTWYAVLVMWDTTQATESDRAQMWINGTRQTSFVTEQYPPQNNSLNDNTNAVSVGAESGGANKWNGQIFQLTYFDGVNPNPSDVFDGSSGKLKALSGIGGAYSLLDASTATYDLVKATNWTNNGSVTTSSSVP